MDPLQPWLDAKEVRRLAEGLLAAPPEVEEAAVDAAYGEVFEGFAGAGDAPDLTKLEFEAKHQAIASEVVKKSVAPVSSQAEEPKGSSSGATSAELVAVTTTKVHEEPKPASESLGASVDSPFQVSSNQQHSVTDVMAVKAKLKEDSVEVYKLPSADDDSKTAMAKKTSPAKATPHESGDPDEPDEPIRRLQAKGPFLSRIRQFSQVIREDLGAKAMFLIDVNGQILLDEVENPKLIQVARTLANASQRANRQSAGAAAVGNLHVKIGASSTLEVIPVDGRYGLLILGVVFPGPIGAVRVMQVADELHRTIEPSQ